MPFSRRSFLGGASAAVLAAFARPSLSFARGLLEEPALDDILQRALAAAKKAGATYADVRIVRRRTENLSTREDHLVGAGITESYGVGVRAIAGGAWGFAASSTADGPEAERVAARAVAVAQANAKAIKNPIVLAPTPANVDVYQTPMQRDPFKIPLDEKVETFLAMNAAAMKVPGIKFCATGYQALTEWKLLATTDGAYTEQDITRLQAWCAPTAVGDGGNFESVAVDLPVRQGGWEWLSDRLVADAARAAGEKTVEKLKSPSVVPGKRDVIITPSCLWLTIHESIGHATELDRAVGLESDYMGTSYATVDKLNKLEIGGKIINVYADKTTPGGLATCGYDDDGVKTQKWDLVKDGVFVGYQTTREQAAWIGEPASRGTSYAQDFASFPFQRMPNVSLAPGAKDIGLADIIASTDDGLLFDGSGSWSIDQQRLNFQFGAQMIYEIKNGKIKNAVRDAAYQSSTFDFWHACDCVGGPREWAMDGSISDGKGQPEQLNPVSHGCAPSRFKQLTIINTNTKDKA
jgi:TldD protein